jgi:hypothetical protein
MNFIASRALMTKQKQIKTPSSEILVAFPERKGSKKYITYLGLVEASSSGSLANMELIKMPTSI